MSISTLPFKEPKNSDTNSKEPSQPIKELFGYEIIDSKNISAISSLVMDNDINTKNPFNYFRSLMQNVCNMTNVLKFNIIPAETKFNLTLDKPIYILDRRFTIDIAGFKELLNEELEKFIWFSYRSNFQEMVYNRTIFTSDAGWGCMIRVAQMILAKGIFNLFQYNSFNEFCNDKLYLFMDNINNPKNKLEHKKTENAFADFFPTDTSNNNHETTSTDSSKDNQKNQNLFPFYSIKEICKIYPFITKGPGEWYSNYDLLSIIQNITSKFNPLSDAKIINFAEGTIYIKDIIGKCFEKSVCNCCALSYEEYIPISTRNVNHLDYQIVEKSMCVKKECQCAKDTYSFLGSNYSLKNKFLMFISVRHGLYELEEEYLESIQKFYAMKHNIGIIGGKNQNALYFIGYNNNNLICLDPHFVQNTCELSSILKGNGRETYKPSYFSVNTSQISPSFSLGFYCRNNQEFKELIDQTSEHSQMKFNLFSVRNEPNQY